VIIVTAILLNYYILVQIPPWYHLRGLSLNSELLAKYEYYSSLVHHVDDTINVIRGLTDANMRDLDFIQHTLIPRLGLNNEILEEQPPELSDYFGTGLHIWQYPSQLARYLQWLTNHAKDITSYCEIGCRWGGMFILIKEWVQRAGAKLEYATAIDPIEETPFLSRYKLLSEVPIEYIQGFSTEPRVEEIFRSRKPSFVFIDGDHSMKGVVHDHLLARDFATIIVHHDVTSSACPDTTNFWSHVKQVESDFNSFEFCDQYESVPMSYLGIGVLERRSKDVPLNTFIFSPEINESLKQRDPESVARRLARKIKSLIR